MPRTRLGRAAPARRVAFAAFALVLTVGLYGASGSLALADPGDPVFPGQDQVDKAKADAQARAAEAGRIQASLDAANRQLHALESSAGQAVEAFDVAAAQSAAARKAAADALAVLARAQASEQDADRRLGSFAELSYRDGPDLARVTILMHVQSLRELTDSEKTLKTMARVQAEALTNARQAEAQAQSARLLAAAAAAKQADAERQAAAARDLAQASAAAEQGQVAAIQAQSQTLLAQLAAAQGIAVALEQQRQQGLAEQAAAQAARQAAAQRAAEASAAQQSVNQQSVKTWGAPPSAVGAVKSMLDYIYAQLGKPYVWGGAGPDVFDCSGLAMRGLEAGGWDFPHPAQWQYLAMTPLNYSELRPGDLVFWADDPSDPHTIYHEAIYIGSDRIIQAPRPGGVVEIQSLWVNGPPSFYGRP